MIKQPGILITRNTFHINDTRRFKFVHFQDIKSNFVSQVITETRRAMSKKYTRISKSHIVIRIVETKLHSAIYLENYSPIVSSFESFYILEMFTSLRSTREWSHSAKCMQISHAALRVAVQPPLTSDKMKHFHVHKK